MSPILCTQPRRFAVVAVAKMVAKSRNSDLGDEIGYHIGHSKNLSPGYASYPHFHDWSIPLYTFF